MKLLWNLFIIGLTINASCKDVIAGNEITNILENASDLSVEEHNGLRSLFEQLQLDYNFIQINNIENGATDSELNSLMNSTRWEFEQKLRTGFISAPSINYHTQLPTVDELIGPTNFDAMSQEQIDELFDMQSILEDVLQEAQLNINEIVHKARQLETDLVKINKPKILTYIYKALSIFYSISVKGSRAAYCTYSYIPALNTSLQNIYEGVDCYTNTTHLIVQIQNETVKSIATIRKNIFDLAKIYQKTNAKHSLVGKILTLVLNATKIAKDIVESYTTAKLGLDALQNEVPPALIKSAQCGSSFVANIPQMLETVSELSVCIRFVEETTTEYAFLQPEHVDVDVARD